MKKRELLDLLEDVPDEVDADALIEQIRLQQKIDEAEAAIAEGRVVSQDEAERRIEAWLV